MTPANLSQMAMRLTSLGDVRRYKCFLAVLVSVLLSGCASFGGVSSHSVLSTDGAPLRDVDVSTIPDAVPQVEPVTIAGNRTPYTVLGRTYHVDFKAEGFAQTGIASWYGTKFHGNKTANGEIYDMYSMTAAHKTLPIPCYVKVTNTDNGRTVVVRVNDRGPFHNNRVIDLSYVAAKKLGYADKGTAKVLVEIVTPKYAKKNTKLNGGAARDSTTYLQVGAFSKESSAAALQRRLKSGLKQEVKVQHEPQRNLFKVLVGPILEEAAVYDLRQMLKKYDVFTTYLVKM